jgi:hypothetical protein
MEEGIGVKAGAAPAIVNRSEVADLAELIG